MSRQESSKQLTVSSYSGLLTHLYQFFGILLGCSGVGEMGFPSYQGDPSMYRVHKYMNLDPNEVGYFISQVGGAAASFGKSFQTNIPHYLSADSSDQALPPRTSPSSPAR